MTALAVRIVRTWQKYDFRFTADEDCVNIGYVEGMNPDGTPNDNAPNVFNDLRVVIVFVSGIPGLAGVWEATTEPSRKWTLEPMNAEGAFHVRFGQYQAWRVGTHHAGHANAHEALVQAGEIWGYRDARRDGTRNLDHLVHGDDFGVNQHGGYDLPHDDMGNSSAGCLVGRSMVGHRRFMELVKGDRRYIQDRNYLFDTTIIPASVVLP